MPTGIFSGPIIHGDAGTYYGQVYESRFSGQPFFTVSRRLVHDGEFVGVLEVSVLPSNFFRFFATLAYAEGQQFALIRDDGLFLARYPLAPPGAPERLDEHSGFRRTVAQSPAGGIYTTISQIDHVERRFAARRFGGTPLYLTSGFALSTIRSEWAVGNGGASDLRRSGYADPVFYVVRRVAANRNGFTRRSTGARRPKKRSVNRKSSTPSAISPAASPTTSTTC